MERCGCVYILTTKKRTVLYTGVTSDLIYRISEHKEHYYPKSFTARYCVTKLADYKFFPSIEEAIEYEKWIKAGSRKIKMQLIDSINPEWKDLYDEILKEKEKP